MCGVVVNAQWLVKNKQNEQTNKPNNKHTQNKTENKNRTKFRSGVNESMRKRAVRTKASEGQHAKQDASDTNPTSQAGTERAKRARQASSKLTQRDAVGNTKK